MSNASYITDLFNLSGKIALVTGSSRGLGQVFARGLAQAGATVILNGRHSEHLEKAVMQLVNDGLSVHGAAFDVTDANEIGQSLSTIEEETGSIDILVNNAGVQLRTPLEDVEPSLWRNIIETHLTGAFLVSRQVVKGMMNRKAGKIINICSLASEISRKKVAPYAAAKGGLKMLTKAMATEWGSYNIQVNGIGPGYFITDMTQPLAERSEFNAWLRERTPMARWGEPAELIGAVIFLASPASSFITGQILYVDGGFLASM